MKKISTPFIKRIFCFCFFAALLLSVTENARAATLTVTKTDDTNDGACNNDCSLREAIAVAVNNDGIVFSSLFDTPQVITLSDSFGQIFIDGKQLTITGKGANLLTVRRAATAASRYRIFEFDFCYITLSGMTISGGYADRIGNLANGGGGIFTIGGINTFDKIHLTNNTSADYGGAIFQYGGVLNVQNSTVSNNSSVTDSYGAGGLYGENRGMMNVTNSTVSGNTKNGGFQSGGGIMIENSRAVISNSTVTDNQNASNTGAAGVFAGDRAEITVKNSIVAGNRSTSTYADVNAYNAATNSGTFISSGYNLIGNVGTYGSVFNQTNDAIGTADNLRDARLYPFGFYGGAMPTHALRENSIAIDRGNDFGTTTDGRGVPRYDVPDVGSLTPDKGAFEYLPMVTNTANSGANSLRQIIADTPANGVVLFELEFFSTARIISLTSGELEINKNLAIVGTNANTLTVRRSTAAGTANFRIFFVNTGTVVNLSALTIAGGAAAGNNINGGGILNFGAALTVENCHITGNAANSGSGGGIFNSGGSLTVRGSTVSSNTAGASSAGAGIHAAAGDVNIFNSTVSGNVAASETGSNGGGIVSQSDVTVTVLNSTITDNAAIGTNSAGGFSSGGTVFIRNTIIAANRGNSNVPDVSGAFASKGYNLIGNIGDATDFTANGDQTGSKTAPLNPLLDALADNGGATPTQALGAGSPAIDKGSGFGAATDQRGFLRPFDISTVSNAADGSDIGAFEAQTTPTAFIAGTVAYETTPTGQTTKYVSGVTLTASGASAVSATTNSSGLYSLDNLNTGGQYTVTPAKTGNINGITPFDATLVLRCVAAGAGCALTANQRLAADANNSGDITPFDATQILRFVAANGQTAATGQVGNWKFAPASRTYSSLSNSLSNENHTAILIGEVNGNWMPTASFAASNVQTDSADDEMIPEFDKGAQAKSDVKFSQPNNAQKFRGRIVSIPIVLSEAAVKTVSGYSFAVQYDAKVLQPIVEAPFDVSGTFSQNNFAILANTTTPGRIGIAASSNGSNSASFAAPFETLIRLRFIVVGTAAASEKVEIGEIILEDENGNATPVRAANGK